ncbi:polysaccharide deacetylase family protein [Nibribacter koreensis]|uniref:Polysaccharide deacetylase family protein n=1 Tax=Nibribacter koreensis TaxID=1084519 RepID=A0ABP8FBR4_9BACT
MEKTIYLTFDDGPIPEVTEFVLAELEKYQAKATFFCVGENLQRNPDIAKKVAQGGHTLGNHTHKHVQAFKTPFAHYLQEVEQCQKTLQQVVPHVTTKLFRPPHGQLTYSLLTQLREKYQVVMWSHLTYDFDQSLSPEVCWLKLKGLLTPGSIVVLHDSLKAERNLRYVLPRLLEHYTASGFTFKAL